MGNTSSTLSVHQLLFYSSYVFRPHHDKTSLNREDVKLRISLKMAACIGKMPADRSFDNFGRQNNTKNLFKSLQLPQETFLCVLPTPWYHYCITSPTMVS